MYFPSSSGSSGNSFVLGGGVGFRGEGQGVGGGGAGVVHQTLLLRFNDPNEEEDAGSVRDNHPNDPSGPTSPVIRVRVPTQINYGFVECHPGSVRLSPSLWGPSGRPTCPLPPDSGDYDVFDPCNHGREVTFLFSGKDLFTWCQIRDRVREVKEPLLRVSLVRWVSPSGPWRPSPSSPRISFPSSTYPPSVGPSPFKSVESRLGIVKGRRARSLPEIVSLELEDPRTHVMPLGTRGSHLIWKTRTYIYRCYSRVTTVV